MKASGEVDLVDISLGRLQLETHSPCGGCTTCDPIYVTRCLICALLLDSQWLLPDSHHLLLDADRSVLDSHHLLLGIHQLDDGW